MCSHSQGIVDKTKIENIMNLMDTMKLSEEESMKALKILEDRWEAYHMMIEDEMASS